MIKSSMNCRIFNATETGKQEFIGNVINPHPHVPRLWLVKSGETLLWMLQDFIFPIEDNITC